ncbi:MULTISPECIES: helix-turn-helix domain-containing protein [Burkholderia cepacia complex]|jgi:DNA-binding IclR family transcriptional regulator|uniref:Gp12 n=3 Tax=root TaxID=1 RepID=Q6QID7_BPBMU|nr:MULTISPECIES: helix-turn-helix domain-containing protein [Burkholderia cepacia complex]YP_024685.1 transcriptional regulator [Burkholderia phage BcepMu]KIS52647.1 bacterial regulatory, arsR family protein [Burkholderia cepacia]AAS47852.1 gp12 [Burkholderia phage BcepMu]ERI27471.1 IclR helix-turn-helix domain protein [Burkholderia cenocepacia BC7]MCW3656988.1 MarR family transcriptional regulator [Burkholderia cenocepacia]MDS0805279.1 MarR family transcriptional regulator [Burkholderia ceno
MTANATTKSAEKVLEVLNVLLGHFAHGLTPGELTKATNLSPSNITRYVATLEAMGFAERIPETGRIRPSVKLGRHAVAILRSLDAARERLDSIQTRLTNQ